MTALDFGKKCNCVAAELGVGTMAAGFKWSQTRMALTVAAWKFRFETREGKERGKEFPGNKQQEARGLPGARFATDFELPDRSGARHKMSESATRNVLVIFLTPTVGSHENGHPIWSPLARREAGGPDHLQSWGWWSPRRRRGEKTGSSSRSRYSLRCLLFLLKQERKSASRVPRTRGTADGISDRRRRTNRQRTAVGAEALLKLRTQWARGS